ncbi:Hsp20/alpha crystallin family protein [Larkinella soli]|uniref:Hsp20/alpha crystallin family protein n=1 Tax=Larkinella soli TaxID=1770527 RepID=UPI000FFB4D3E|nr:Hsp20/alpha crystallin family protein [Larkinella soli]
MTTLVRYNRLPSLFDRMVAREFNRYFSAPAVSAKTNTVVPAVNVKEDDKAYHIEVAVPGLKKEDFTVNLENNYLTIASRQEQSNEEKAENFTRKEFSYSSFQRSFRLPKNVNNEQIQAAYTDGILKIELPKAEPKAVEPKQIAVA